MTSAIKISPGLFVHDPRSVFFATPELTQRINLIHHLIGHSEQLLLVLAEEGRGKTTLLHQVKAGADEHWRMFALDSNPELRADALVAKLLGLMNVRPEGKPSTVLRDALRSHIAATRYNGLMPVLLVDDAHMLPLDSLELLVQLAMGGEPQTRMRVLLFCEPQITSLFAAPEFEAMRHTLIHTLDIPPLSEKQLKGYLQFSLQQANFRGDFPFDPMAVRQLHRDSEGVPAAVNRRARQMLSQQVGRLSDLSRAHRLPGRRALWVILAVALAVGLAVVAVWFKDRFYPPEPAPAPQAALEAPPAPSQLMPDELAAEPPVAPAEIRPGGPVVIGLPAEAPATPAAPPPAEATPPAPAENTAPPTDSAPAVLAGVNGEPWLRQQNPEQYTIQILGAYNPQALASFLDAHKLRDHAASLAMFKSVYKDKDWYVLVSGVYADRTQANEAIARLPAALRQATQPWVRSLGSIQTELERMPR